MAGTDVAQGRAFVKNR